MLFVQSGIISKHGLNLTLWGLWYNLTIFDFVIIFHLKKLFILPCSVLLFSAQPHMCDCTIISFILTYYGPEITKNNIKSE